MLDFVVIRSDFLEADRPVGTDAEVGLELQVVGLNAGGVGRIVQGRPTDASAGIVAAERNGIGTGAEPFVVPEEFLLPDLVGREIFFRVLVLTSLQRDNFQAGRCQTSQQRRTACARTDHNRIDCVVEAKLIVHNC